MNIDWLIILYEKLPFHALDYLVISLNFVVFLFAKYIINQSPTAAGNNSTKNRMQGLRAINLALFFIYIFAAITQIFLHSDISHLQQISQTGLTILLSYIMLHYTHGWIILRFGKQKEIDGEKIHGESYSSEMVGLIGLILVSSIAILVIINIWELNNWLQATSVIGGVLLILFASKDYFLGDLISGLIMHYNSSVESGSVIRVKELDITGVVMQITLSQTIIRDLVQKHEITITNSRLRNATIETISNCAKNGFRDFIDFKIGYNFTPETVQTFLANVWLQSSEKEAGINCESKPKIVVIENGDHAVTWRLLYFVKNPYRTLEARNTIQTVALELSQQQNIGLNTPMTHQILSGAIG